MSTIVVAAAVSEFGDDSDECEQLGGTRKSDRKKAVRKPKNPKLEKEGSLTDDGKWLMDYVVLNNHLKHLVQKGKRYRTIFR